MEFNKEFLEKEFKKYYKQSGTTATHVFMYSKEQDRIDLPTHLDDGKKCFVNNKRYSEMRSRDGNSVYLQKYVAFVSVGCYSDIERR